MAGFYRNVWVQMYCWSSIFRRHPGPVRLCMRWGAVQWKKIVRQRKAAEEH